MWWLVWDSTITNNTVHIGLNPQLTLNNGHLPYPIQTQPQLNKQLTENNGHLPCLILSHNQNNGHLPSPILPFLPLEMNRPDKLTGIKCKMRLGYENAITQLKCYFDTVTKRPKQNNIGMVIMDTGPEMIGSSDKTTNSEQMETSDNKRTNSVSSSEELRFPYCDQNWTHKYPKTRGEVILKIEPPMAQFFSLLPTKQLLTQNKNYERSKAAEICSNITPNYDKRGHSMSDMETRHLRVKHPKFRTHRDTLFKNEHYIDRGKALKQISQSFSGRQDPLKTLAFNLKYDEEINFQRAIRSKNKMAKVERVTNEQLEIMLPDTGEVTEYLRLNTKFLKDKDEYYNKNNTRYEIRKFLTSGRFLVNTGSGEEIPDDYSTDYNRRDEINENKGLSIRYFPYYQKENDDEGKIDNDLEKIRKIKIEKLTDKDQRCLFDFSVDENNSDSFDFHWLEKCKNVWNKSIQIEYGLDFGKFCTTYRPNSKINSVIQALNIASINTCNLYPYPGTIIPVTTDRSFFMRKSVVPKPKTFFPKMTPMGAKSILTKSRFVKTDDLSPAIQSMDKCTHIFYLDTILITLEKPFENCCNDIINTSDYMGNVTTKETIGNLFYDEEHKRHFVRDQTKSGCLVYAVTISSMYGDTVIFRITDIMDVDTSDELDKLIWKKDLKKAFFETENEDEKIIYITDNDEFLSRFDPHYGFFEGELPKGLNPNLPIDSLEQTVQFEQTHYSQLKTFEFVTGIVTDKVTFIKEHIRKAFGDRIITMENEIATMLCPMLFNNDFLNYFHRHNMMGLEIVKVLLLRCDLKPQPTTIIGDNMNNYYGVKQLQIRIKKACTYVMCSIECLPTLGYPEIIDTVEPIRVMMDLRDSVSDQWQKSQTNEINLLDQEKSDVALSEKQLNIDEIMGNSTGSIVPSNKSKDDLGGGLLKRDIWNVEKQCTTRREFDKWVNKMVKSRRKYELEMLQSTIDGLKNRDFNKSAVNCARINKNSIRGLAEMMGQGIILGDKKFHLRQVQYPAQHIELDKLISNENLIEKVEMDCELIWNKEIDDYTTMILPAFERKNWPKFCQQMLIIQIKERETKFRIYMESRLYEFLVDPSFEKPKQISRSSETDYLQTKKPEITKKDKKTKIDQIHKNTRADWFLENQSIKSIHKIDKHGSEKAARLKLKTMEDKQKGGQMEMINDGKSLVLHLGNDMDSRIQNVIMESVRNFKSGTDFNGKRGSGRNKYSKQQKQLHKHRMATDPEYRNKKLAERGVDNRKPLPETSLYTNKWSGEYSNRDPRNPKQISRKGKTTVYGDDKHQSAIGPPLVKRDKISGISESSKLHRKSRHESRHRSQESKSRFTRKTSERHNSRGSDKTQFSKRRESETSSRHKLERETEELKLALAKSEKERIKLEKQQRRTVDASKSIPLTEENQKKFDNAMKARGFNKLPSTSTPKGKGEQEELEIPSVENGTSSDSTDHELENNDQADRTNESKKNHGK